MKFIKKPIQVEVVQFLGEDEMYDWLKTCGVKLPKSHRVGKFWNVLHDKELEVSYGDWIVMHDPDDRYPIKDAVLKRDFEEINDNHNYRAKGII